jgi:hypothetical protein
MVLVRVPTLADIEVPEDAQVEIAKSPGAYHSPAGIAEANAISEILIPGKMV